MVSVLFLLTMEWGLAVIVLYDPRLLCSFVMSVNLPQLTLNLVYVVLVLLRVDQSPDMEEFCTHFQRNTWNIKLVWNIPDIKTSPTPKVLSGVCGPMHIEAQGRSWNWLLQQEVIFPIQLSKWATPIVPVIKNSGSEGICRDSKVIL